MPKNDLLAVIRSVHAWRRHVPAEVAARLAEHMGDDDLTVRELEVLRLIRDGYRNKQIADQLSIAETTVNFTSRTWLTSWEPMTGRAAIWPYMKGSSVTGVRKSTVCTKAKSLLRR